LKRKERHREIFRDKGVREKKSWKGRDEKRAALVLRADVTGFSNGGGLGVTKAQYQPACDTRREGGDGASLAIL